ARHPYHPYHHAKHIPGLQPGSIKSNSPVGKSAVLREHSPGSAVPGVARSAGWYGAPFPRTPPRIGRRRSGDRLERERGRSVADHFEDRCQSVWRIWFKAQTATTATLASGARLLSAAKELIYVAKKDGTNDAFLPTPRISPSSASGITAKDRRLDCCLRAE